MRSTPIRCGICGQFFESKKDRRRHVDQAHRITDADIIKAVVTTEDAGALGQE